jgi:hypothetical protein
MPAEARGPGPHGATLPGHLVAEQKPDGLCRIPFARPDLVMLQSRQGADLTPAPRDIAAAAASSLGEGVLRGGFAAQSDTSRTDRRAPVLCSRAARRTGRSGGCAGAL